MSSDVGMTYKGEKKNKQLKENPVTENKISVTDQIFRRKNHLPLTGIVLVWYE